MPRMRIYDAEDIARDMRERFADREVEFYTELPFSWPSVLQNVGDSLAVGYASDKWKPVNKNGKRELELYKHLAESRNRALVCHGLLRDLRRPERPWPVIGPDVDLAGLPMPKHFALLGLFEELNLQLYVSNSTGYHFGKGDDGLVCVKVRHGLLGASKILWSKDNAAMSDEPFLFVYTEDHGVLALVVGDELDVEKDGIVG